MGVPFYSMSAFCLTLPYIADRYTGTVRGHMWMSQLKHSRPPPLDWANDTSSSPHINQVHIRAGPANDDYRWLFGRSKLSIIIGIAAAAAAACLDRTREVGRALRCGLESCARIWQFSVAPLPLPLIERTGILIDCLPSVGVCSVARVPPDTDTGH